MHKTYAAAAIALLGSSALSPALALPTAGQVTHGSSTVSVDDGQMVIEQHSDKLITNWSEFNIDPGQSVTFKQPSRSSAALNNVTGFGYSNIAGALRANGNVFVINPNGVIFTRNAQVDVGGLVASSQAIKDADFLQGRYQFSGTSTASVDNHGTITAQDGGVVALLGGAVNNQGIIRAQLGTIALAAGRAFTLTFDGNQLLNVQIDEAAANALINSANLLSANGGQVLIKAQAADATLHAVINHQGIIEANTLDNQAGRIVLDGGAHGQVRVAGRLSAAALNGAADAGTIDTRGHDLRISQSTQVDTHAAKGRTGVWTLGSASMLVGTPGGPDSDVTLYSNTLIQSLARTSISLNATNGDLSINAPIAWANSNSLALNASGNTHINHALQSTGADATLGISGDRVFLNQSVTVAGDRGRLTLDSQNGHVLADKVRVTLPGQGATFSRNGYEYAVVQNVAQLQAITKNLTGHYVLGNSIKGNRDFRAIGGDEGVFSGVFDGLGHTLTTFSVTGNGPNTGLFSASSGTIQNVALQSVSVSGPRNSLSPVSVGSLVGHNTGSVINVKSWDTEVQGSANRENVIGGLIGTNAGGQIERATVSGSVMTNAHTRAAGGLVGENISSIARGALIADSSAHATVSGFMQVSHRGGMGGLVGVSERGAIRDSITTGRTASHSNGVNVGGLVGTSIESLIQRATSNGLVQGGRFGNTGGLVGENLGGRIYDSTTRSRVEAHGDGNSGGAVGRNTQAGELHNVSAVGHVADWRGRHVGGMVGDNDGMFSVIDNSYAAGEVDARHSLTNSHIGGFVGNNSGAINDSESHGKVHAGQSTSTGGFAGYNGGRLERVSATNNVSAGKHSSVGGLVGTNAGAVHMGSASGQLWGGDQSRIGGVVGVNLLTGKISDTITHASLDGGFHATLGGFAGFNQGVLQSPTVRSHLQTHWYTWLLGQTRGEVAGKNTGSIY